MSKLSTILGIIGKVGPQVLMFTKLAPIAQPLAVAMQVAQQFQRQPDETDEALNARRLASVIEEGQAAAAGINAQAGKIILDPDVVAAVGGEIISTTKAVINTVHDVHTNADTGNAGTPNAPALPSPDAGYSTTNKPDPADTMTASVDDTAPIPSSGKGKKSKPSA